MQAASLAFLMFQKLCNLEPSRVTSNDRQLMSPLLRRLADPIDIVTYEPLFQPWRDLENEILNVFDRNNYSTIVTPEDLMGDEDNLADAVLQDGYT